MIPMSNPIVIAKETRNSDGRIGMRHSYWCPGCDSLHAIAIRPHTHDNGAGWEFSGTLECPTYAPSQLTTWDYWRDDDGRKRNKEEGPLKKVCHTFIRGGMIEFLGDCTHHLVNQTVPLPPLPDWMLRENIED
jgi:Family of unknown function (DUF6527)